jgi:hypothetical protein
MSDSDAAITVGMSYVVGISGHRDIPSEDRTLVRVAVEDLLTDIKDRMPEVTIELISGLAAGADMIAADAALALQIPVRAVLPMPIDLYRADFSGAELERFETLVASPGIVVEEIPLPIDVAAAEISVQGPVRDDAYARLGDYIARRSNLPLVLWDGILGGPPGGTADTLNRALATEGWQWSLPELDAEKSTDADQAGRSVAWIPVRRSSEGSAPDPNVRWLMRGYESGRVSVSSVTPVAAATEIAALQESAVAFSEVATSDRSQPLPMGEEVTDPSQRRRLQEISDSFVEADTLALQYGASSTRVFQWLAIIAAAMGFFFLVYAKVATIAPYIIAYLVLVIIAVIVSRYAAKREWLVLYLSNRAVAETARIRFHLAGIDADEEIDVDQVLDLTGVGSLAGLELLRQSRRVGAPLVVESPSPSKDRVGNLMAAWVDDQAGYLKSKVGRLGKRERQLNFTKSFLIGLSIVAAVLLLFFAAELKDIYLPGHIKLKTALIFLMGLLPLWLGIWELYQYKLAFQELNWQFENQARHYASASDRINETDSWDQQLAVIRKLGEQSLFEVYLWVIHRYHREIEPTLPG